MAWRPVVKRQAFPQEGPHMRWAPVQQALVTAIAPLLTDNFGRVTVQTHCGCMLRLDGQGWPLTACQPATGLPPTCPVLQARHVRPAGAPVQHAAAVPGEKDLPACRACDLRVQACRLSRRGCLRPMPPMISAITAPSLFGSLSNPCPLRLHSPASLPQVFTPDAQILITAAVKGSREELESGLRKFINTQLPAKSLARLTWDHDAAWVHDYAQEVLGGQDRGLVCFKVGIRGGAWHRVGGLHGAGAACGFQRPATLPTACTCARIADMGLQGNTCLALCQAFLLNMVLLPHLLNPPDGAGGHRHAEPPAGASGLPALPPGEQGLVQAHSGEACSWLGLSIHATVCWDGG